MSEKISGMPLGATPTGVELIEVSQLVNSVLTSVQLTLAQVLALAGSINKKCQALGTLTTATAVNLASGDDVSFTVGAALALTFTGTPAQGNYARINLHVTNGGAFTLTWPSGMRWAGNSPPVLTTSGEDWVVIEIVNNTGTPIYYGSYVGRDL